MVFVSQAFVVSPPDVSADHSLFKPENRGLQGLAKHPFCVLALLCLFVNAFFNVEQTPMVSFDAAVLLLGVVIAGYMLYFWVLHPEQHIGWQHLALGALFLATLILLFQVTNGPLFVLGVGLIAIIALAVYWLAMRSMTSRRLILLLLAAGFVLRVAYILYTAYYARQHDVWLFGSTGGHAVYIEWFYEQSRLPDFDPRSIWQYYHPPLHHIITAIFMRINVAFGMTYSRACESTQVLTLFYASACTLLCYKLMREVGVSRKAATIPMALLCFHPTLILMSGSINNDILSVTLQLAALLFAVRWYKNPSVRRILCIALTLGCSMMAKSSGGVAAVAIAFLFLYKLIEQRHRFWHMVGQFAVFGVVCVPLGLWWQVYNFIQYDMPISYVPLLSSTDAQYIGDHTVWERLFDFSSDQLKSVFVAFGERSLSDYYEYNVLLGLLKTSVFGEFFLFEPDTLGNTMAVILFWINVVIVAFSLFAMVWAFCRKSAASWQMRVFFGLLYLTVLGSYITFCIQYPHTCTQNIRYAVATIFVGLVAIGLTLDDWQKNPRPWHRPVKAALGVLTGAFCAGSTAVYALLGA